MRRNLVRAVLFALAAFPAAAGAQQYKIDVDHSSVTFKVRHVVSQVRGGFDKFQGTFTFVPGEPGQWKADATVDVSSINTRNAKRDKHLRGPDFFDVDKNPEIKFVTTKITSAKGDKAKLHGSLTMRGVTKDVVLDLELHGEGQDPWGNKTAGFSATGKVNRKDFGINWNKALDKGGFLVGDDVEITIDVEGNPT